MADFGFWNLATQDPERIALVDPESGALHVYSCLLKYPFRPSLGAVDRARARFTVATTSSGSSPSPVSNRATADWVVPSFAASSF